MKKHTSKLQNKSQVNAIDDQIIDINDENLISAVRDRHEKLMSEDRVLFEHQIDLDVIDEAAKKMGKYNPLVNDAYNDVKISTDEMKNAKSFRRAHIYKIGSANIKCNVEPPQVDDIISDELKLFEKFASNYIFRFLRKQLDGINIVNIGVKKGRLTNYLRSKVQSIMGVVFNAEQQHKLAETFPLIKFVQTEPNTLLNVKELEKADVILIIRILYEYNATEILKQLEKLDNRPLIIITLPTAASKWQDPTMNANDEQYNSQKYNDTMKKIQDTENEINAYVNFATIGIVEEDGNKIYILQRYKLDVTAGMLYTKNAIIEAIDKYPNYISDWKNPSALMLKNIDINLADIGTGGGRYALFLSTLFNKVVGIDNDTTGIEIATQITKTKKVDNLSFIVADAEYMSSLLPVRESHILLFSGSFHLMRFDEVMDQIALLKLKPLIIVKEANKFTTAWNTPAFDKNNTHFDKKLYDNKMFLLNLADKYLLSHKYLVEHKVDEAAGSTIYILSPRKQLEAKP